MIIVFNYLQGGCREVQLFTENGQKAFLENLHNDDD